MNKPTIKVGDTKINNQGVPMTVIEYVNSNNMTIKFEDGLIRKCTDCNYKRGQVLNYNIPTIYNKGYLGAKESTDVIKSKVYNVWKNMLRRCYGNEYKFRTYKDVEVCEEWYNFQNFKKWYYNNIWDCDEKMCLDKDIIKKNNKIYSPQTCIIVPNTINLSFTKNDAMRGNFPIGVNKCGENGINTVIYNEDGTRKSVYIGKVNNENINKAFNIYKNSKEQHIKRIADYYKSKYSNFPNKIYDALYNYQVEITD